MTLQDNPLDFNNVPPAPKGRRSRRMSVARLAELLNDRIADLAVELLGTPNRALSSAQQLRFGTKGSIAVEIAGKDAGRWYDHEAGTGGAGPELIRHHFGMDEKAAWDWARNWLGDAEMPASWTAAKPATRPAPTSLPSPATPDFMLDFSFRDDFSPASSACRGSFENWFSLPRPAFRSWSAP